MRPELLLKVYSLSCLALNAEALCDATSICCRFAVGGPMRFQISLFALGSISGLEESKGYGLTY